MLEVRAAKSVSALRLVPRGVTMLKQFGIEAVLRIGLPLALLSETGRSNLLWFARLVRYGAQDRVGSRVLLN